MAYKKHEGYLIKFDDRIAEDGTVVAGWSAVISLHFDLQPQFKYINYFIYTSHHFTPRGRYELNTLTSLPTCGFIAQLVEYRTGIAEVMGSNPVEALIFSGFFFPVA